MVLYGYDASVYSSIQVNKNWVAYFDKRGDYMIGLIASMYSVGAIVAGWFLGGPIADYLGRKMGMGVGCFLVCIATFVQGLKMVQRASKTALLTS